MKPTIRVALLDLNNKVANKGMGYLCQMMDTYSALDYEVFDVRHDGRIPDMSFDIYISSGGPGSPFDLESHWSEAYFAWIDRLVAHNQTEEDKKHVFFICHSFQLACMHFQIGEITERSSMKFGIFPVQKTAEADEVFDKLPTPFYAADFRYWQVKNSNPKALQARGAKILALETVETEQTPALMAIRFTPEMIGTQFHPEADEVGMKKYLVEDERKENIIRDYGAAQYQTMLGSVQDDDKIALTFRTILPTFMRRAIEETDAHGVLLTV